MQGRVEVGRLKGLADTLRKVTANIPKFPFTEESYDRFINEFGSRGKNIKKFNLL